MKNMYFLLLLLIRVFLCTSQTVETTTEAAQTPRVWRIYEIEKLDQSLLPRYDIFNDGAPSKYAALEAACDRKNDKCLNGKNATYGPLCTHQKDYGLVSFSTVCEINFKNCLINIQNENPEAKSKKELFYYNEIGKTCDYYVDQTSSMDNAIKMYLLHGKMRRHYNERKVNARKNNH